MEIRKHRSLKGKTSRVATTAKSRISDFQLRMIRSKRSQGVFGMSFGVIFSIILIVFFLVAAFIAIKFFLGFQKQAEFGIFLEDLQAEINGVWKSHESSVRFESLVNNEVDYVCFINMSAPASGSSVEGEIYSEIRVGNPENNFAFYPPQIAADLSHAKLEHFAMPLENPLCIPVNEGKVEIIIEKNFGEALPRVSGGE
jgi:hypothetical protein